MMNSDYLEDTYRPAYETWKQDQTPEGNATLLNAIDPIVQKGIQMYGPESPLAASRGRLLALDAVRKYDPKRSRLQSHLLNHMQGLRRITQQQHSVIRVPERILIESQKLRKHHQELTDTLGREPSDPELSDSLGVNPARIAKIRSYQPGMSSGQVALSGAEPATQSSNSRNAAADMWTRVVHQGLNPFDQRVLELSLGLNGNKKLSNQEIASKLNRSAGAISQRKSQIQNLLDQERDLSPFISE